jgi:two-component system cell cycle response regulator
MTAIVLVVDDLEQNVKLLEAKLFREYYTVVTANSGASALDVLACQAVDVVLLDVMMPEMDGFETCRKIKSNPDTMHIPVVMVTALSGIEDRVKGLECGADEFLTKPTNDTALFARVKSLARMKNMIDELKLRNKTKEELGGQLSQINNDFSHCRILIMDDDFVQAKNIKSQLSCLTNNLEVIKSLDDLRALVDFTPDLVIISCQLDSVDPLRIGTMMRSKDATRNAVLMLLAEDENLNMVIKGIEIGFNDYFLYPVEQSELIARVKTQLRRKWYQDDLRSELEERIDLSIKDALTGVFNRRYFDIHIRQMIERVNHVGQKMCMIMLDMDYFKEVNDNYGHQAGDEVLKTLAKILKDSIRLTDLIARYGGEEFAILLNITDINEGVEIANRVLKQISSHPFSLSEYQEPIFQACSMGVAEYRRNESIEEFIGRVDDALYSAKESGRNRIVVG